MIVADVGVQQKRFELIPDTAMRLSARDGQFPLVLFCDSASNEAALKLRKAIAAAQATLDLWVLGVSSYLAQVILLLGSGNETIEQPIPPISWSVRKFSLVRSFFGQSRYEVVKRSSLALRF